MWARIVLFVFAASAALAAGPVPPPRFAQPVRVGDLIGRKLIGPSEAQPLLGHVEAVMQTADGAVSLRVRTWSTLPWRERVVDVPTGSVALLGESVALIGLTAAQLLALPASGPGRPDGPDATIELGLVRPFH